MRARRGSDSFASRLGVTTCGLQRGILFTVVMGWILYVMASVIVPHDALPSVPVAARRSRVVEPLLAEEKDIVFLRHGEGEHNVKARGFEVADAPLTARGRVQAQEVASLADVAGVDLVLVSPLRRTVETAVLAFPGAHIVALAELALGTGAPSDTGVLTGAQLAGSFPGLDVGALAASWPAVDAGDAPDTRDARLRAYLRDRPEKRVAIVTHAAVARRLADIRLRPAQVGLAVFDGRSFVER